jgi:hypothetical protein
MTAMNRKYLQAALVLLLLGLQSCSLALKPDLERLYQQNREVRQPPVIVIHGLMGSRLEDTDSGKEIWVGNPIKLLFSDYAETALEIDPETLLPKPSPLVTDRTAARTALPTYCAGWRLQTDTCAHRGRGS